jgi:hypothetical protein
MADRKVDAYEGGMELEINAARHGLELEIQRAQNTLGLMQEQLNDNGFPGFDCPTISVNQEYFRLRALMHVLALYREEKTIQEKT